MLVRQYYCLVRQTRKTGGYMIVQNCLGLLKDLHLIEEEIAIIKKVIKKHDLQIDEEAILEELIKKKIKSST